MMGPRNAPVPKDARICVVGAGPAGLSATYYLKQQGYTRVTVLERRDRVGGMCHSMRVGNQVVDVGAYVVPDSFTNVRRLGAEFRMALRDAGPVGVFQRPEAEYVARAPTWRLARDAVRFARAYSKLSPILRRPGLAGVSQCEPLCTSIADWLRHNSLSNLLPLFESVLPLLAYGPLETVATAYALKHVSLAMFLDVLRLQLPVARLRAVRVFIGGYQTLWERVAAKLDVRLGVEIQHISRDDCVRARLADGESLEFDYLILACPLNAEVLGRVLKLSSEEAALCQRIIYQPCYVATYDARGARVPPGGMVFVYPVPGEGRALCVTRPAADGRIVQFYLTMETAGQKLANDGVVDFATRADVARWGGVLSGACYAVHAWEHYFPHVTPADIAAGFYDRFEALQGKQHTFYTGGLFNFDTVERTLEYTRHLVETHIAAEAVYASE